MMNLVLNKMEETFQSNTLDWSSLVIFIFLSHYLRSAVSLPFFHRIFLIFGQLIDNNL